MFDLSDLQIPPPKNWQHFESLCRDLWAEVWGFPDAKKHGRSGQAQHGVDVYGRPQSRADWAGVQCKGKDSYTDKKLTKDELNAEVKKALRFKPALTQFTLATTGPRDAKIQELARLITTRHAAKGLFTVDVVAWEDIVELLEQHSVVLEKHYPQFAGTLPKLKHLQGLASDVKDTIGGQIKKEAASLHDVLHQLRQDSQMATTIDQTSIIQVLSRIEDSLGMTMKGSKSNGSSVEVLPPDKQRTLGLFATKMFDGTASSNKKFIPSVPWERDARFLVRKGVLVSKKGVLSVPSRIKRSLLSSEEFKNDLHQQWLKALQPLKTHPDVAVEISWHFLRLGEHWKAVEVFIDLAAWGKPRRWEETFCNCLLAYRRKEMLKRLTPDQRIRFHHACIEYLINCDRGEEALPICGELRSLSNRHENHWGAVQSYLKEAEVHEVLDDDPKAIRKLRRGVAIAESGDDGDILADAKYRLAIHIDDESPSESLALLAECADLRRQTDNKERLVDVLISSGVVCSKHDELESATNWFREACEHAKSSEYSHGESLAKLNLGLMAIDREDYTTALRLFRESRKIAEPGRYLNNVAGAFESEGVVLNRMGRHKTAQSAFEQAFAIREDNEDWCAAIAALNNVGAMLLSQQKATAGRKKLRDAYKLAVKHGSEFWAYHSQLNVAISFLQCEGNPKRATDHLRIAAKAEEKRASFATAGDLWQDRVFLLIEKDGRPADIDDAYECALRCFGRDWESVATLHEGAFTKHRERGNSEAAILVLRKLATLAEKKGDLETRGRALAQLGACLIEQEHLEGVEELLLEAIRDGRKSKCSLLHVFLHNTGEYYSRASNPTKAAKFFAQAAAETVTQHDFESAFDSIRSQAFALGDLKKFDDAESAVKEFCKQAKTGEEWLPYVAGLQLQGDLSWWRNRPKAAEHHYRRALDAATKYETQDAEASVRLSYAKALAYNGEPEAALTCLKDSLLLFDTDALEHEYHSRLAEIYETLSQTRQERRHRTLALEKAIASEDSDSIAEAAWAMADVHEERGEFHQAAEAATLAVQHELDDERRMSIMMKRLSILLRLQRKKPIEEAFEDIQALASADRFVAELVDAHVWIGDYSVENGESLVSAFKHYLAASYYAYAVDAKTVGEVEGHMLHRLSLIETSDRHRQIRQLETNCLKWLKTDPNVKLSQSAILAITMPFRVARRLSLLASDWREVSDSEFDRIFDEELPDD